MTDIFIAKIQQLLEQTLALREKDNEILKLKAELAKQQNSIQQPLEQTLAKQKQFQDQMKQMTVQRQAETRALQNQIQQLKSRWQQQQKYYANMFTNGPPVFPNTTYPIPTVHPNQSSLNSSLIQELPYLLNMQTQTNKQHHFNMAPSYDGKDPKQFYTWLDDTERLSIQNKITQPSTIGTMTIQIET